MHVKTYNRGRHFVFLCVIELAYSNKKYLFLCYANVFYSQILHTLRFTSFALRSMCMTSPSGPINSED